DGLRRQRLDPAEVLFGPRLAAEPRWERVVLPGPDHHVPDVGKLADELEERVHLAALDPFCAMQLVDDDPARDGGTAGALFARVLEHLAQEAPAIRERASVIVVA